MVSVDGERTTYCRGDLAPQRASVLLPLKEGNCIWRAKLCLAAIDWELNGLIAYEKLVCGILLFVNLPSFDVECGRGPLAIVRGSFLTRLGQPF